jgi:CRISPR/Cas system-associated exonuclease Cas4 (RecB family)
MKVQMSDKCVVRFRRTVDGLRAASEWIAPRVGSSEIVIVGATRAASYEFARQISGEGSLGVHRMTLLQLAEELARPLMSQHQLGPLSRLGADAVAARVVHRLYKSGKLVYFAPVARLPGFPSALALTLADLRLAHILPEKLDSHEEAVVELSLLLAEYQLELQERRLADIALLLSLATEFARSSDHHLVGCPLVLLDIPVPSLSHIAFIKAVAARTGQMCAIVQNSDEKGIAAFEAAIGHVAEPMVAELPDNALSHVVSNLFSTVRPPEAAYDSSVDLFSAPGEGLEVTEIARRIRGMAERGVAFDHMAILLRSVERYQPMIEEVMSRAGVPVYFSMGSVRPDPAGRAFLALLGCATERCSASRFAEYLSIGETPELDFSGRPSQIDPKFILPNDEMLGRFAASDSGEPGVQGHPAAIPTPIAWERMLIDASVTGGRERWHRRLKGLRREYQLQLAELRRTSGAGTEHIEQQLERLKNLEKIALPLIDMLAALPTSATWGNWLEHLRPLATVALRHPESVLAILSELEPMAEVGPASIDEVTSVLATRLRFLRSEPPDRRYGRVLIAAVDEIRGRSFDVVFLPGLAEGLFPRRPLEDPLLLDGVRMALSTALRLRQDRVAEERQLLHLAVGTAAESIIVSFPSMDLTQGRPRVPSLYVLEIARAVEGRIPKLRAFELRTQAKAEARLTWPAPLNPINAIDDGEYDLSWYGIHADERGSCRYLEDANQYIYDSLRTRYRRWERKWSPADGVVGLDVYGRQILNDKGLNLSTYSASTLQHFAACPYRFYLHGIYGLRPRERFAALEQLDPLTRGALFHVAQFQLFQEWRKRPTAGLGELLDSLDDVLNALAQKYEEDLAPAIPRVWRAEVEELRTDLRGWMRLWYASLPEWEPLHFELGFGLVSAGDHQHDSASTSEPLVLPNLALLRGSIDLVEQHRHRGVLRVVDHKTGKQPQRQPVSIGGGTSLQPALYALAAEKLLGKEVESGRLDYCTQRGGYMVSEISINAATRQRLNRALAIIQNSIESGFLPAAPQEGACLFCDYRLVCGPNEEVRVKKWKPEIEALRELRRMP